MKQDNNSNEILNVCYIESLTNKDEFKNFKESILNLDSTISQLLKVTIVSNQIERKDIEDLNKNLKSLIIFNNIREEKFINNLNNIELGIVPSLDEISILDTSIFFISSGIPILCPKNSGDCLLSCCEFFKYETQVDFSKKLSAIINDKSLLKDYFDNLDEVTPQFIEECVEEKLFI